MMQSAHRRRRRFDDHPAAHIQVPKCSPCAHTGVAASIISSVPNKPFFMSCSLDAKSPLERADVTRHGQRSDAERSHLCSFGVDPVAGSA
jgi:hypothetical protein